MTDSLDLWLIFNWSMAFVFMTVGMLIFLFIHIIPGAAYLGVAMMHIPSIQKFLRDILKFSIPRPIMIIVALTILIVTLANGNIGDLIDAKF